MLLRNDLSDLTYASILLRKGDALVANVHGK